jgi:hypothetical protein
MQGCRTRALHSTQCLLKQIKHIYKYSVVIHAINIFDLLLQRQPHLDQVLNFIMAQQSKIKAFFFDFMGTCVDWHSSAVQAMPSSVPQSEASKIAIDWHQQYFHENSQRSTQGLPPEDTGMTPARALGAVLDRNPEHKAHFNDPDKENLVRKWHSQAA